MNKKPLTFFVILFTISRTIIILYHEAIVRFGNKICLLGNEAFIKERLI